MRGGVRFARESTSARTLDIPKMFLVEERRVRERARGHPVLSESLHDVRRAKAVSCPITVPAS